MGVGYLFYFALGWTFEKERQTHRHWNIKKLILAGIIVLLIEALNKKYDILNSFFAIIVGSFLTYILQIFVTRYLQKLQSVGYGLLLVEICFMYTFFMNH